MTPFALIAVALLSSFTHLSHAQNTAQTTSVSLKTHQEKTTSPPSDHTTLATSTTTSVYAATTHETGYPAASATPSHYVDTAGGASGTDTSSFSLSSGGLIAIIVVVVGVSIFGIVSIVLFVLAKRRQWNVRASIRRASRRLTGRDPGPTRKELEARKKRSGIVAGSSGGRGDGSIRMKDMQGQKTGVVVEVRGGDEEKGPQEYGTPPKSKKSKGDGWAGRLWGNDWK